VAFLGALVLLDAAIAAAVGPIGAARSLLITGGVRLVEILGAAAYWRMRGWGLADLGLDAAGTRRGWVVGSVAAVGFGLLVVGVEVGGRVLAGWSLLRRLAGSGTAGAEDFSLAAAGILLVVGGLVAPACEELVFRGVLYGSLRRRLGPVVATVLVAGLFAAAHGLRTPVPWVQAVGGVLFCAAYEFSGSLWAPFLVHASGNLTLFLLPRLLS
jgi:membrane protease YdiL (CAAX protease family)